MVSFLIALFFIITPNGLILKYNSFNKMSMVKRNYLVIIKIAFVLDGADKKGKMREVLLLVLSSK
jgi:hypothetical protein